MLRRASDLPNVSNAIIQEQELLCARTPVNTTAANTLKIKQKIQENRHQILAIAEKHGAFNVRIFGSVAKGLETEASDIDFLVDYDLNKVSPWFPGGLLMDLQDLLGCKVDIATDRGLSKFIKAKILKEAKSL